MQLVPLPVLAAPAHEAPVPRRARPAILAHHHPRHRARSAASPGREGHRARRVDGEDRIQPAPHVALRAGRHLHERHRQQGWRWPGRHLRARSRDVRDQGRVGARSRPAVSVLRLLVAPRPRHDDHQRVGHAEDGRRRRQPRPAARRQVRERPARVGPAHAPARAEARARPRVPDAARAAARAQPDGGLRLRRRRHQHQGSVGVGLGVVSRRRHVADPESHRDPRRAGRSRRSFRRCSRDSARCRRS